MLLLQVDRCLPEFLLLFYLYYLLWRWHNSVTPLSKRGWEYASVSNARYSDRVFGITFPIGWISKKLSQEVINRLPNNAKVIYNFLVMLILF